MSDSVGQRAEWVRRVLGVNVTTAKLQPTGQSGTDIPPQPQVRFAPMPQVIPTPPPLQPVGPGLRPRSDSGPPPPVRLPGAVGPKTTFDGADGRKLEVTVGTDGKVALTAPKPPLQEITFSGGGGKGSALPGAVAALQASGTLDQIKVFNGASVGSMTAALLAAGISSDEFMRVSNDPNTSDRITEGRGKYGMLLKGIAGSKLSGDELENIVRDEMGGAVRTRIQQFIDSGVGTPEQINTAQAIATKTSRGGGVTFGDLRTLAAFVPGVKEVNVSGTMMGDDSQTPGRIEKGKPQLMMFSADTEPDLDVARAVHASTALPPVFQPVNIRLSSGISAQFQDGGVMNNAPTTDLVGAKRSLDPVPTKSDMTFIFEDDDSKAVLQGDPKAARNSANDFFTKAENSAADFAKNRGLADKPEDVVMVPLTFRTPGKNGKKGKKKDFTGLMSGTVNMKIPLEDMQQLQANTATETLRALDKRKLPETREFESPKQMLNCIPQGDLQSLAQGGFPGAQEELDFRTDALEAITHLEQISNGARAGDLENGPVRDALDHLQGLAGTDVDRQGFVARELNRSGALDPLMTLAKEEGTQGIGVLDAGVAVACALDAKARAQTVLREVVYPKMVRTDRKGGDGALLANMDAILRSAQMPEDVNDALQIGIDYFQQVVGRIRKRPRDAAFAAELGNYLFT
jgi:exoenzyme U